MQLAPDEYLVKVSYSAGPEGTGREVKFHTQSQLDGTRCSASQTSQQLRFPTRIKPIVV